jgi:hypothetical protein
MTEPAAILPGQAGAAQNGSALYLCAWCDRPFTPRRTGGHDQRFCRLSCRRGFHATARQWTLSELAAGRLSLAAIKNGLPATRALAGSGGTPSPVQETGETLDALLINLLDALPEEAWFALPNSILDQICAFLDGV